MDPRSRMGSGLLALASVFALAGCATPAAAPQARAGLGAASTEVRAGDFSATGAGRLAALLPADAWLLGEQHDAPEHQRLQAQVTAWLIGRGELAGLALEMAEAGRDTKRLPRDADAASVRAALAWDERAWPWAHYGASVMAAVRAGVPVAGANLPRAELRAAMADPTLDARLSAEALAEQRQRIRDGHCGLLPERQIAPMARVQIARDVRMAATVAAMRRTGKLALLIAGNSHVDRRLGVPLHLPPELRVKVVSALAATHSGALENEAPPEGGVVDLVWQTPASPARDYCAALRPAAPS